jgi:hypothetical protein
MRGTIFKTTGPGQMFNTYPNMTYQERKRSRFPRLQVKDTILLAGGQYRRIFRISVPGKKIRGWVMDHLSLRP